MALQQAKGKDVDMDAEADSEFGPLSGNLLTQERQLAIREKKQAKKEKKGERGSIILNRITELLLCNYAQLYVLLWC